MSQQYARVSVRLCSARGFPCFEVSSLRVLMKENTYFFVSGSNSNVMNNFPHAFLTTNKQTLPISLVHIFTAIATRLGLNASPINFPGTVLAHVLPRHEAAEPIIVNASHPTNTILNSQINNFNATHLPPFQPCTGLLMLMRASRNILSSLMSIHDVHPSILHPSLLLSICVHLLFQAEDGILDRLLADAYLQAWDCIFLLDRLAPSLMSRCRGMIRSHCQTVLDAEAAAELNIHNRTGIPVKYFVGMAFEHVRYKYIGFIYGWDVSPSLFCHAWLLTSCLRLNAKRPKTGLSICVSRLCLADAINHSITSFPTMDRIDVNMISLITICNICLLSGLIFPRCCRRQHLASGIHKGTCADNLP